MSGEVYSLFGGPVHASAVALYARKTAGFDERLARTVELL
jgi:hypothetical protein